MNLKKLLSSFFSSLFNKRHSSSHSLNQSLEEQQAKYTKNTRIIISLSVVGFVLFLGLAVMLPFKDKLLSTIYPKPQSKAFERVNAAFADPVYVFNLRAATQEFRATADFELETNSPNSPKRYDIEVFVSTLQGIVNRNSPRLYLYNALLPYYPFDELGRKLIDKKIKNNIDKFLFEEYRRPAGWLEGANILELDFLSISSSEQIWQKAVRSLLEKFPVKGIVVWDPNVPSTVNIATTVAGLADLPVVRHDTSVDSLYTFLTKSVSQGGFGIKPVIDFYGIFASSDGKIIDDGGFIPNTDRKVPSTGSAKNNAYLWAKYHYLDNLTGEPQVNPESLAYLEDAFASNERTYLVDCSTTRDMAVKKRAFVFDLSPVAEERPIDETNPNQPKGTDYNTFKSILDTLNKRLGNDQTEAKKIIQVLGYVPIWDKYNTGQTCLKTVTDRDNQTIIVPIFCEEDPSSPIRQTHGGVGSINSGLTEMRAAKLASSYNAYYTHLCDGGTNLSFHSQFPAPASYPAQNQPPPKTLENKTYITFNSSDVDGPDFVARMLAVWKNSTKRGLVPYAWSFDPQPDLMPYAYLYFYQNKTPVDFFTGGNSGPGWMLPGELLTPRLSGLPSGLWAWKTKTSNLYKQFNIDLFTQLWSNQPMKTELKNAAVELTLKGLAGIFDDPETEVIETEPEEVYKGVAIKNINYSNLGLHGNPQTDAVLILNETLKQEPSGRQTKADFLLFRDVMLGPDYAFGLMKFIKNLQADPNNPLSKFNFEVVDPYTFFALFKESLTKSVDNPGPAKFSEVHPSFPTTKATTGTFDIIATGATNTDMIWYGAWTNTNGADDLKWYQGVNQVNGNWIGKIDLSKHTGLDTIYVRACATNNTFPQITADTFCKDTSFQRVP